MKTVFSNEDLQNLQGRFVIQLNNEDEHIDITKDDNDGFWLEKRISFVSVISDDFRLMSKANTEHKDVVVLNGIYSVHDYLEIDEFANTLNGLNSKGEDSGRFYRLMNKKELQWLFIQMAERNA